MAVDINMRKINPIDQKKTSQVQEEEKKENITIEK